MVAHRSNKSHIKHNKQVEMHLSLLPKHLIVFDLCSGYKKKKTKTLIFFSSSEGSRATRQMPSIKTIVQYVITSFLVETLQSHIYHIWHTAVNLMHVQLCCYWPMSFSPSVCTCSMFVVLSASSLMLCDPPSPTQAHCLPVNTLHLSHLLSHWFKSVPSYLRLVVNVFFWLS